VDKVCYNETSEEVEVSIRRSSEEFILDSIRFVIGSEEFSCPCDGCAILNPGSSKKYKLKSSSHDELRLFVNDCSLGVFKIQDC